MKENISNNYLFYIKLKNELRKKYVGKLETSEPPYKSVQKDNTK